MIEEFLGGRVDYEKELEREKMILSNIDYEPTVTDEWPLAYFKKLTDEYRDVKWIGKSMYIVPLEVLFSFPYQKESLKGES